MITRRSLPRSILRCSILTSGNGVVRVISMQALSPVRLDVHDVDCYRVICLVHASNYCKTTVLEIDWNLVARENRRIVRVRVTTTTPAERRMRLHCGNGTCSDGWSFPPPFLFVKGNVIRDKIDGMNLWSELDVLSNWTRVIINGKFLFSFPFSKKIVIIRPAWWPQATS